MTDMTRMHEILKDIKKRKALPPPGEFLGLIKRVNNILENEDPEYRPYGPDNLPGGIIYCDPDVTTILVPDLHARMNFIYTLVTAQKCRILSLLEAKEVQIICLGDGLHSEGQIKRWLAAYDEYKGGYEQHQHMDQEMIAGIGTMEMIMHLKCSFPGYFHYLKGNHDNIADETKEGNYSFRKYAAEGEMVATYMLKMMGQQCFEEYYWFEKNLPLLVVGLHFLASHAEPYDFFNENSVLDYRDRPDVIQGLTWTDNNKAHIGSVQRMIRYYIDEEFRDTAFYFGGHRPVSDNYTLRARGRYVQFHNPRQYNIVTLEPDSPIDLEKAIASIGSGFPFF